MAIVQDVATIAADQAKILGQLALILPEIGAAAEVVNEAISAAAQAEQKEQTALLAAVQEIAGILKQMVAVQSAMAADIMAIREQFDPDWRSAKGAVVDPGIPTERKSMSALMQCKWAKKSKLMKAAAPHKPGDPIASFQMTDNEDGTATVNGVNAVGDVLDLSSTFTLSPVPVSDTPAVVSVDAPVGMTFGYHGLSVGSANVAVQATQNAGLTPVLGPFAFSEPFTCTADQTATGIVVNPGTPTPRTPVPVPQTPKKP